MADLVFLKRRFLVHTCSRIIASRIPLAGVLHQQLRTSNPRNHGGRVPVSGRLAGSGSLRHPLHFSDWPLIDYRQSWSGCRPRVGAYEQPLVADSPAFPPGLPPPRSPIAEESCSVGANLGSNMNQLRNPPG